MDLSYVMGILALIIFVYRFVYLLIPMFKKGIKTGNNRLIFNSLTMLV